MRDTLDGEGLVLRARIAHPASTACRRRLKHAVALAAALACLLVAPSVASAACPPASNVWQGDVSTSWATAGNWLADMLPTTDSFVCIPVTANNPTLTAPAVVQGIQVDAGAGLTLDGADLTLEPTLTTISAAAAPIAVNNGAALTISAGAELDLNPGASIPSTGTGSVVVDGKLVSQPAAATMLPMAAAFSGNGTVVVGRGILELTGGGLALPADIIVNSDTATDSPTLSLGGNKNYFLSGIVSDRETGGIGHVKVSGATTNLQLASSAQLHIYDFTMVDGTLDATPACGCTDPVTMSNVTVLGGLFELGVGMTANSIVQRGGKLLGAGSWSTSYFHWGGGDLEAPSIHGQSLTVTGTLDTTYDPASGDTGVRTNTGRDLIVTGTGTQSYPYVGGSMDLSYGDLVLGPGVRLQLGDDGDILQARPAPDGKIINHGVIDKHVDLGAGSTIDPQIDMPDGEIWVTQNGTLTLTQAPVQYGGGALNAGRYVLDGTLQFPGPITTLGGGVVLNGVGAHLIDTTGPNDVLDTLTGNSAGSTLTISTGAALTPANDFTNNGTIVVTGIGAIIMAAGKNFTNSPGATATLSDAGSAISTSGGGSIQLAGGAVGGIGILNGDVQGDGTIAPGNSPGTLTINGNYTQTPASTVVAEVGGSAPNEHDRLIVTGQANLAGTLQIVNFGGFAPALGQAFDFVAAGAVNGTFASVQQPGAGLWYSPSYTATAARALVNGVTVGDTAAAEGGVASFPMTLDHAEPGAVSVDWATTPGSAGAADFAGANGTVTFAPGETATTVTVQTTADGAAEPDEAFAVNLSNPVGTRIARSAATGSIPASTGPVAAPAVVPAEDIDGFLTPPPPVQGKKVNVEPVSGKVLVKLPRTTKFIPLPDAEQVPVGTIVDATKGVVRLFSVGTGGRVQSAIFYEGVFQVLQKVGQAMTEAKLVGGNFARACGASSVAQAAAKRSGSKSVRHLWASGSGKFRTAGRYASATIRGTKWLTDDRCNGTRIRLTQGAVTVRDLTLKKTLAVRAPKSYLAPAKKR